MAMFVWRSRPRLRFSSLHQLLRQQIREPGKEFPSRAGAGEPAIEPRIKNQVGFHIVICRKQQRARVAAEERLGKMPEFAGHPQLAFHRMRN